MYQDDRLRRLGDKVKDRWQESVIDDGPLWSGNIRDSGNEEGREGTTQATTRTTVHALLLLYGETVADLQAWGDEVGQALAPHGVRVVHQLALDLQIDNNGIGREHFGFADGMSQPIPFGDPSVPSEDTVALSDGQAAPRDPTAGPDGGIAADPMGTSTDESRRPCAAHPFPCHRTRPGRLGYPMRLRRP